MNSWCAPSCPSRRSFVASDAHRPGQLCTVPTNPDSTYNSGNAVQTTGATSPYSEMGCRSEALYLFTEISPSFLRACARS